MTANIVRSKDHHMIASWYYLRGLDAPALQSYPILGYCVDNVAAGFMYRVENKFCIIEGYVTNPRMSGGIRNEALTAVTDALLKFAVKENYKRVMILTEDASIVKRAEAWGFGNKASKLMLVKGL